MTEPKKNYYIKPHSLGEEIPPGFTVSQSPKGSPLPLFVVILLILPYIRASQTRDGFGDSGLNTLMKESDTILDILSSMHPYLDSESQNSINIIFGVFETTDILRSLAQSTYQAPHILSSGDGPMDHRERALGIIKSIQPYISKDNQILIDKVIHTNDAVETLTKKLQQFRRQDVRVSESTEEGIARVAEIIDTIKLLVPPEQQQALNQINKILRIVDIMEVVQQLDGNKKSGALPAPDNTTDETPGDLMSPDSQSEDKTERISNALKTMLNPEQAQSLDLIMKMAQVFTQSIF